MGFLSGAYGKLMAGKLVRDLQYQRSESTASCYQTGW